MLVFFFIDDVYIFFDKGGGIDVDNLVVLLFGKINECYVKVY